MANSRVFEWATEQVEKCTQLNTLQARGVLRLALKEVGLNAAELNADHLRRVAEAVLEGFLARQGVENAAEIVRTLQACPIESDASDSNSVASIFRRLG